jgi:hypothetical protein
VVVPGKTAGKPHLNKFKFGLREQRKVISSEVLFLALVKLTSR